MTHDCPVVKTSVLVPPIVLVVGVIVTVPGPVFLASKEKPAVYPVVAAELKETATAEEL